MSVPRVRVVSTASASPTEMAAHADDYPQIVGKLFFIPFLLPAPSHHDRARCGPAPSAHTAAIMRNDGPRWPQSRTALFPCLLSRRAVQRSPTQPRSTRYPGDACSLPARLPPAGYRASSPGAPLSPHSPLLTFPTCPEPADAGRRPTLPMCRKAAYHSDERVGGRRPEKQSRFSQLTVVTPSSQLHVEVVAVRSFPVPRP